LGHPTPPWLDDSGAEEDAGGIFFHNEIDDPAATDALTSVGPDRAASDHRPLRTGAES
jgi:hypothetical protein